MTPDGSRWPSSVLRTAPTNSFGIEQRHQLAGLAGRDLLEVDAEIAALGDDAAQPVHARLGRRQQHAAGQMHAGRLAGQLLDLLVEADRVFLQLGDVGVAVDRVHAARRMPGRPRRQLVALDQHDVGPAGPGQMEQHRAADDPAPDDHDLRMRFHGISLDFRRLRNGWNRSGRQLNQLVSVLHAIRPRALIDRHKSPRSKSRSLTHGSPLPISSLRLATYASSASRTAGSIAGSAYSSSAFFHSFVARAVASRPPASCQAS